MWIQTSFKHNESSTSGILYIVPTPIGNLEDITFRAVRILKEVDFIAAEDTRNTKKLCRHFEILTPLFSYHDHNKNISGQKIIRLLEEGKHIAIVSDAGTPCVSDPGYEIVVQAVKKQIPVIALPGASASITALSASGLDTRHFYFYGFLDRSKKKKRIQLENLKAFSETMIFYESPHRLKETLFVMLEVFGNRQVVVLRELTKVYEQIFRGRLEDIQNYFSMEPVRGEFCILAEGTTSKHSIESETSFWKQFSVVQHVNYYIENEGMSSKEAVKQTAADREMSRRDVYQAYHIDR